MAAGETHRSPFSESWPDYAVGESLREAAHAALADWLHGCFAAVERGDAPLDSAAREALIRNAAYRRAEYRGFAPGHDLEDWLAAERDIDYWITARAAPRRYAPPCPITLLSTSRPPYERW